MSEEVQSARRLIRDRVRQWFSDLRAKHPTERFYAFAFACHDDFRGPSLWANSLETLEARDITPDDEDRVWNPGEWPYSAPIDEAWQDIVQYDTEAHDYVDEVVLHYRAFCLAATIAGLRDLADEGLWTREPVPVLAFLTIWDSAEDKWLAPESVRRINSPQVFQDHPLEPYRWLGDVFLAEKPRGARRRDEPSRLETAFHELFKYPLKDPL
jgi:hypothetical protein